MASPDGNLGPEPDFIDLVNRCMVKKGESPLPTRDDFATPQKALHSVGAVAAALEDELVGGGLDFALEKRLEAQFGKAFLIKVGLGAKSVVEKRDALRYLGQLFDCLVDHGTPYDKLPDISRIKAEMKSHDPVLRETPPPTINPPRPPEMKTMPPAPPDPPYIEASVAPPGAGAKVNAAMNSVLAVAGGLALALIVIVGVIRYNKASAPVPSSGGSGSYSLRWSCGNLDQCAMTMGSYTGTAVQGVSFSECQAAQQRFKTSMQPASGPGQYGSWCAPS